jgi:hypothetical protein
MNIIDTIMTNPDEAKQALIDSINRKCMDILDQMASEPNISSDTEDLDGAE